MRVAVECFADLDLFRFLSQECGLGSLVHDHSESQGEVINNVFARDRAEVGIVDEDPQSTHHRLRDRTKLLRQGVDIETRELDGRRLIIVKPDLENCFIGAMKRLGLKSEFQTSSEMHRSLANAHSRKHARFRAELLELRAASRTRGIASFVTEIEDELRA